MLRASVVASLAAVLSTGCGAPYRCDSILPIGAEFDLDCSKMDFDVELVRELLDKSDIVSKGEFRRSFSDVSSITLFDRPCVEVVAAGCVAGRYNENELGAKWIELDHSAESLAHELLHHLDGDDPEHETWIERGFWNVDHEYKMRYEFP